MPSLETYFRNKVLVSRSEQGVVAISRKPGVLWFILGSLAVVIWAFIMDTAVVELTCYGGNCLLVWSSLAHARGFYGMFRGSLKAALPASRRRFLSSRLASATVTRVVTSTGRQRSVTYAVTLELRSDGIGIGSSAIASAGVGSGAAKEVEAVPFHSYSKSAPAEDTAMSIQAAILHAQLQDSKGSATDESSSLQRGPSGKGSLVLHVREDTASWDEVRRCGALAIVSRALRCTTRLVTSP